MKEKKDSGILMQDTDTDSAGRDGVDILTCTVNKIF